MAINFPCTHTISDRVHAMLSEKEVELLCEEAIPNALAGNTSKDFDSCFEWRVPKKKLVVIYTMKAVDNQFWIHHITVLIRP